MRNPSSAMPNLCGDEKHKEKLIIIKGSYQLSNVGGGGGVRVVPKIQVVHQHRLARIQSLQHQLAYVKYRLNKEWMALRFDVMNGAEVEPGPLGAFKTQCTRWVRVKGSREKQPRTYIKLEVR